MTWEKSSSIIFSNMDIIYWLDRSSSMSKEDGVNKVEGGKVNILANNMFSMTQPPSSSLSLSYHHQL